MLYVIDTLRESVEPQFGECTVTCGGGTRRRVTQSGDIEVITTVEVIRCNTQDCTTS